MLKEKCQQNSTKKINAIGPDYVEECNELKRQLAGLEKDTESRAFEIAKEGKIKIV